MTTVDTSALRESHARDRRAVRVGTAVTGLATLVLFVLPDVLPVESFASWYFGLTGTVISDNPFTPLRLGGGIVGGAVAGWLTSDLGAGIVTGLKAALFGLVLAYVLAVTYYVLYSVAVGTFPPPLLVIAVVPMIYAIPLFMSHVVGGAVAGLVVDYLR